MQIALPSLQPNCVEIVVYLLVNYAMILDGFTSLVNHVKPELDSQVVGINITKVICTT